MILGKNCTRNYKFCNVIKAPVESINPKEPINIANAVKKLSLKYVVITSVTRDDLNNGGADHFTKAINSIKNVDKNIIIEILIPDFQGNNEALTKDVKTKPEVINHNVETIPSLYSKLRPRAMYEHSLEVLKNIKKMALDLVFKFVASGPLVISSYNANEAIDLIID